MGTKGSILIYGLDDTLLKTRCLVLESAGFRVKTAREIGCMDRILNAEPIEMLILCHTVGVDECAKVLAAAHAIRPEMKNLLLAGTRSECAGTTKDFVLNDFASARTLLMTVRKLADAAGARV